MGADLDRSAILFLRDKVRSRFRYGFRIAGGRAAIIAPTPDLLTLVAMALPMALLYESCIWIAWIMERRAARLRPT